MKISKSQLNELLRLITRQVLKEMATTPPPSEMDTSDADIETSDAKSEAEQNREKRQKQIQAKREADAAKQKKITDAEKAASGKSVYDNWRKFEKSSNEKAVKDAQLKVAGRI